MLTSPADRTVHRSCRPSPLGPAVKITWGLSSAAVTDGAGVEFSTRTFADAFTDPLAWSAPIVAAGIGQFPGLDRYPFHSWSSRIAEGPLAGSSMDQGTPGCG